MSARRDIDKLVQWLQLLRVHLDDAAILMGPDSDRPRKKGRALIERCLDAVLRIEKERSARRWKR